MISPHFPPDASAATHRARVLAPYLESQGWRPTVLTVRAADYEGQVDDELLAMVSGNVEVMRVAALPARLCRLAGVGDLGLRALPALRAAVSARLASDRFDAAYITTYPVYPAVLGPWIKRRFDVPFVLDLQDPWVGEWGKSVGPGTNGAPDVKSRLSRAIAQRLERHVLPQADAITSVSSTLLDELADRYPVLRARPRVTMPIGIDPADVASAGRITTPESLDKSDGRVHICYVGTMLPLAYPSLTAFFFALRRLFEHDPSLRERVRVHFVGTSNQSTSSAAPVVMSHAHAAGLADIVREHPPRIGYRAALATLLASSIVLVMGSTERRYTASKLAPALASGRPLLVIAHHESDIRRALRKVSSRGIALASFDAGGPGPDTVECIARHLGAWLPNPPTSRIVADSDIDDFAAPTLARALADVLKTVASRAHG
jgi:hypothetical protein